MPLVGYKKVIIHQDYGISARIDQSIESSVYETGE